MTLEEAQKIIKNLISSNMQPRFDGLMSINYGPCHIPMPSFYEEHKEINIKDITDYFYQRILEIHFRRLEEEKF